MHAHTTHIHMQAGAYAGGGGGGGCMVLGGQTPPFGFHFLFACLLVRDVGHVRGYPYPVCGNLTGKGFPPFTSWERLPFSNFKAWFQWTKILKYAWNPREKNQWGNSGYYSRVLFVFGLNPNTEVFFITVASIIMKSLFPKRVKSTFGTSEKNRFLWQNLYTCLWENKI